MKKKFFKSKIEMIVSIIVFILFIWGFIYFGNKDYSITIVNETKNDSIIFNDNNIFEFINASDALNLVKGKNVIMLFGVNNDITKEYGNLLNDIAKECNITKMYYYDITLDREDNNASYRSLVDYLSGYATYLEASSSEIYGPTLFIKSNGTVIYFDNAAAVTTGKYDIDEYFNNYTKNSMKNILPVVFEDYLESK